MIRLPLPCARRRESRGRERKVGGPGELEHDGGHCRDHTRHSEPRCFLLMRRRWETRRWARAPRDRVHCSRDTSPPGQQTRAVGASTSLPVHCTQDMLPSVRDAPRRSVCCALSLLLSWGQRPQPMAKLATTTNSQGTPCTHGEPTEHPRAPTAQLETGAGPRSTDLLLVQPVQPG